MTTLRQRHGAEKGTPPGEDTDTFRQRLLDGLTESIAASGYRNTTVTDIVRRARTSRRTFYQHFSDKEACLVALLTKANAEMIRQISDSVDPKARWDTQIRQAVRAWIASAESAPALTVSWIRDLPSLGTGARELQRDLMDAFITMIQTLRNTEELRAAGLQPVSRQEAVILIGGLRELMATTVEQGGRIGDIGDLATRASIALLGPRE